MLPDATSSQLVCLPPPLDGFQSYNIHAFIKTSTVYVPSSELRLSQPLSRQRVWGWGSPNSDDLKA